MPEVEYTHSPTKGEVDQLVSNVLKMFDSNQALEDKVKQIVKLAKDLKEDNQKLRIKLAEKNYEIRGIEHELRLANLKLYEYEKQKSKD